MQRLLLLRNGAVWTRKRTLTEVKLVREQQHVIRTFTNFNLRGLSNDHGQRPEGSQTQAVATQSHSGSRPANRTRWNSAAPPDVDSPVRLGLLDAQASHSLIDLDQDVENDSQLPRLPVPPLRQTLERYLQTLRPLVSEEDLAYSAAVVEEFGQPRGLGELLQEQLLQKVKRTENWLFDWWVHSAFLDCRLPLVVHSNPGVLFPKQDFHDIQGQLRFASRLIAGVLSFKSLLDRGQLPRSHYHGRPLCMDQYTRIFSSCRIPGPRRDSVINYGLSISEPRHITVAHNNQFFKLDVYHYNGCPLTQGQIYTQLEKIWNSSIKTIKEPVGILTADHRNRWGVGRRILMKDWLNRESIEEIQQSIFAICLDAPMPHGHDEYSSMAAQILHGGGSHSNTGNRWFDKTLQFIVGEDGTCGLLYERALAEGMPIMRISDHAMQFCKYPERAVSHGIPLPMPKKLHLNISSEVQYLIETSKIYLDIQVNDLDICCFEFSRFGKNFPKWYRLSPDGFIQMALQLAFYRLHGHVCASSETATTWMFHLGRTDEIRVTLEHTVRFVCGFDDVNTTDAEKLDLLKKAIAAHKENTNQAVIGQGIDRHLFGLKMQAIESGFRVPEIFMDTAYAISTHFRLSTNQIPSQMNSVMCYGPVVPDGYNICYNPLPYHANFTVTALNSSPQTNAKHLSSTLISALNAMHDLLDQHCGVSPWETAQW